MKTLGYLEFMSIWKYKAWTLGMNASSPFFLPWTK